MLLNIRTIKHNILSWIWNQLIYTRVLSEAKLLCRKRYKDYRICIKSRIKRKAWNGLQLLNYKIKKQKHLNASKEWRDRMEILIISGR